MIIHILILFTVGINVFAHDNNIVKIKPTINYVSVIMKDGEIVAREGKDDDSSKNWNWIAKASFEDLTFFDDGWGYLEVDTRAAYGDDLMQSYCAGYCEGVVTHEMIYNSWRNTQEGFCKWKGDEYCKNLRAFLSKNIDWMKSQIRDKRTTDPIWHHVELILSQLKGLSDGYSYKAVRANRTITLEDLLLMNLSGDLESLDNVLNEVKRNMSFDEWVNSREKLGDGHCSALIKVLPGVSDLYVSQDTWNTYQSMLRIQKKYNFEFHHTADSNSSTLIPGRVAVFSSYPAYLTSGDDFYLLSSGLTTLETTIGNSNPALWKYVQPEGELLEWIRAIISNRLATSAKKWSDIFKQYNSGTYNNQWMIVDYKLFKPGKPIRKNTLWVLEQLPGYIESSDQSKLLAKETYFASYNTPFYPTIFNMSGSPALVEKYGDWFTYDKNPRALIFKRNHTLVTDMDSMIKLMRYNNFKEDPLSRCNCTPPYSAENSISARSDLNPKNGSYPFAALGHRSHGGTDMKVTSHKRFLKMRFLAVNGPTYDQQPVFKWSEQDFANNTPHYGHPDEFKFPVVEHKWIWNNL